MLSKKHDNTVGWRQTLEAASCLPGITVADKYALWDRLHNRLQQNPGTKKAAWYWIAAAILPFIIIALTMGDDAENELMMHTSVKEKPVHATSAILLPASKESATVFVSPPAETGRSAAGIESRPLVVKTVDTTKAIDIVETFLALPEKVETASLISNVTSVDTLAVTSVIKKKLPVVHINDLETLPAGFNAPANYTQNLSGKAKRNKITNLTITSQPNSIGVKIKLSSKN